MKKLIMITMLVSSICYADFKSEDEVSMVTTGGNTEVKTYVGKTNNSYTWGENIIALKGNYTYGEAGERRNIERWDALLKYDRVLEKKMSLFVSELIEANRFAGIDRRYNTDVGMKYTLIKNEYNETSAEAGYRYTFEKQYNNGAPDNNDSKGRLFVETNHKFNKIVSGKLWVEYLPNFTDTEDYLINIEPSFSVVLTSLLSLKISYLWNYDNEPVLGNGKHDYTYTTGLLAKF